MKILMIGHSYVVALNRRLCREVARAAGNQAQVTVVAPSHLQGDLRPIDMEPLEGEPYELVPLPYHDLRPPHLGCFAAGPLRRLFRRERWDIVHAWCEPYVLMGAQVARYSPASASLIISTFQNIPKRYPPPFNWIERYCMRRASAWTAFGTTVESACRRRRGFADRPGRVIPLGVDRDYFRPEAPAGAEIRRQLGWAEPRGQGPPVIGYLGRFVPEKGLHVLMNSLDGLADAGWRALFVGGGPMEPELRAWAEAHPRRDAIRIVTGIPHDRVPPYINAMDLLAAPSQTRGRWKEQLGRMLLEAMACGVPVVASDSGEIPHVVGDAGRIVPEANVAAWTHALDELLRDPHLRRDLSEKGLDRTRDYYDWPIIGRQFLDFFLEVRPPALATSPR